MGSVNGRKIEWNVLEERSGWYLDFWKFCLILTLPMDSKMPQIKFNRIFQTIFVWTVSMASFLRRYLSIWRFLFLNWKISESFLSALWVIRALKKLSLISLQNESNFRNSKSLLNFSKTPSIFHFAIIIAHTVRG